MKTECSHFCSLLSCFCIFFYFYILSYRMFSLICFPPLCASCCSGFLSTFLPISSWAGAQDTLWASCQAILTFARLCNNFFSKSDMIFLIGFIVIVWVFFMDFCVWCFCLFVFCWGLLHTDWYQRTLRFTWKNWISVHCLNVVVSVPWSVHWRVCPSFFNHQRGTVKCQRFHSPMTECLVWQCKT